METKPPPQRYRIVERKGRLIVIDRWAKGAAPSPATPLARAPLQGAQTGGLTGALVALACSGARDDTGRPILTTAAYYDQQGPRQIALCANTARWLGRLLLGAVLAAAMVLALLIAVPHLLVGAAVLIGLGLGSANTAARPWITRRLDHLADDTMA